MDLAKAKFLEDLDHALTMIEGAYRIDLNHNVYRAALEDLQMEDIRKAAKEWIKRSVYVPRPADLRKHALIERKKRVKTYWASMEAWRQDMNAETKALDTLRASEPNPSPEKMSEILDKMRGVEKVKVR